MNNYYYHESSRDDIFTNDSSTLPKILVYSPFNKPQLISRDSKNKGRYLFDECNKFHRKKRYLNHSLLNDQIPATTNAKDIMNSKKKSRINIIDCYEKNIKNSNINHLQIQSRKNSRMELISIGTGTNAITKANYSCNVNESEFHIINPKKRLIHFQTYKSLHTSKEKETNLKSYYSESDLTKQGLKTFFVMYKNARKRNKNHSLIQKSKLKRKIS